MTLMYNQRGNLSREMRISLFTVDRDEYIRKLQEETTLTYIPAMVFVLLIAVVGVVGNSLVLFVYSRRFSLTTTRVFIFAIAAVDLCINVIIIPAEVYEMFNSWEISSVALCRARLMVTFTTTIASAIFLFALASIRYRKEYTRVGNLTVRQSKFAALVILLLSLAFAAPAAIINGRHTRPTPRYGFHGYECSTDDGFVGTLWPTIASAFYLLMFVSICVPVIVLYTIMIVRARRFSKAKGMPVVSGELTPTEKNSPAANETKSKDVKQIKAARHRSMSTGAVKVSTTSKTVFFSKSKAKTASEEDVQRGVDPEIEQDGDVIEYFTDDDDGDKINKTQNNEPNTFAATRMVTEPGAGPSKANLSMVRELTVKLRAVQKQNSREEACPENVNLGSRDETSEREDISNHTSSLKADEANETHNEKNSKASARRGKGQEVRFEDDHKILDDGVQISENQEAKTVGDSKKTEVNLEAAAIGIEANALEGNEAIDGEISKREDDENRVDVFHNLESKDGNSEAIAIPPDAEIPPDIKVETSETDTIIGEAKQGAEPMSDFVKSMLWVDLTYAKKDDSLSDNGVLGNDKESRYGTLSKKDSFSKSRKISRDNSFLQKHKKFRETLTDTLARARKGRRQTVSDIRNSNQNGGNDTERYGFLSGDKSRVPASNCRLRRTTLMLIIITGLYIIGFLPSVTLMLWNKASPHRFKSISGVEQRLFNLGLRFHFLNSAVNAIVYVIVDSSFRRECARVLRKIAFCGRSSSRRLN